MLRFLVFFFCLVFAVNVHGLELTKPTSRNAQIKDDLQRYAKPKEIKELIAGEDTFIALLSEQQTAMARGVAIIMPDWTLNQNQISALSHLRYSLNDIGWVTIAGTAPEMLEFNTQLEKEQAESLLKRPDIGSEILTEAAKADYRLALRMRFESMKNLADEYPGLVMFIAQGASAGFLVELFDKQELDQPDALILIEPYLPEYTANEALPQKVANLDAAVLDIWSAYDNRWALATVDQRRKAARKYLTLHYRQRQLFGDSGWEQRDARLSKEIYAYLTHLGW